MMISRDIQETGPIRPPSEANSILLRVTRNCPWNRCRFCGLYKGTEFSIRPLAEIHEDLLIIKKQLVAVLSLTAKHLKIKKGYVRV